MGEPVADEAALEAGRQIVREAGAIAQRSGRGDLARRLAEAGARLERPASVVCVVGEFKQGKSALVNALIGADVCPVDDDLATAAVMVLRHAPATTVTVHRRVGRDVVVEPVEPGTLAAYASESGERNTRRDIGLIEVGIPNALLSTGLTLVDTPGVGGLNAAHAAATLAFLPSADGLIFVSDASAELTATEAGFLDRARATVPALLFVLSKTDLYPGWRTVLGRDQARLRELAASDRVVPTSSIIRQAALRTADASLNAESGFPDLLIALQSEVLAAAARRHVAEAMTHVRDVAGQLMAPVAAELAALGEAGSSSHADDLAAVRARLAHLRGPGARWAIALNDGFAELSSKVDHDFRVALRRVVRATEERIDEVDPAAAWTDVSRQLQLDAAAAVRDAFDLIESGAAGVRDAVITLIREEHLQLDVLNGGRTPLDPAELWTGKPISGSPIRTGLGAGWGALRGAQGGLVTLGMLTTLLGLTMAAPVLIGAAVIFGTRQVRDDRRRQLTQRRQEALGFVRQFADDVQFEVGTRIRDRIRDQQRVLRETFSDRLDELGRTYAEVAAGLERTVAQTESERREQRDTVTSRLAPLEDLLRRVDQLST